jgi:hypothetical protein
MVSELQREIAQAVRAGSSLDQIEQQIIDPADIDEDEKAALWLYADALEDLRGIEREPELVEA